MGQSDKREELLNQATGVLAGALLAFACCLLVLLAGAALITSGQVGEERLGLFCLLGAFLGCAAGGTYAAIRAGQRALIVAGLVSLLFFGAWLAIGAGVYQVASLERGLPLLGASLGGGVAAGFLGASRKTGRGNRK